jgi:hypothetical protein
LERSLNGQPIEWFPGGAGKWGAGLAPFGFGGFGYDGSLAAGLGRGAFGLGAFGFDAEWAEWLSDPLPPGTCCFAAVSYDSLGNAGEPSAEFDLTILATPSGMTQLSVAGSAGDDSITLSWAN